MSRAALAALLAVLTVEAAAVALFAAACLHTGTGWTP